jgi:hypothetical protein
MQRRRLGHNRSPGFARSVCFARVGLAPGLRVPGYAVDAVHYFVLESLRQYRSDMSSSRHHHTYCGSSSSDDTSDYDIPAATVEDRLEERRKHDAVLAVALELARAHARAAADRDREAARAAAEIASVDQHAENARATERAAARAVMVRAARGMEDVVEWDNLRRIVKFERKLKCKRFIVKYERVIVK